MRVDNKHTTVTEKGVSFIGTYEGCIMLRSYYSIALRSNVFLGGGEGRGAVRLNQRRQLCGLID